MINADETSIAHLPLFGILFHGDKGKFVTVLPSESSDRAVEHALFFANRVRELGLSESDVKQIHNFGLADCDETFIRCERFIAHQVRLGAKDIDPVSRARSSTVER